MIELFIVIISDPAWVVFSMDDIVGPLKEFLSKRDPSKIENFVFRLHVRVTFAVLFVCMALVSQIVK